MMEYKIRHAERQDGFRIYELVNHLKRLPLDSDLFRKRYNENLTNPHIEYWVLEAGTVIMGVVGIHQNNFLHHDEPVYEITELVIDKKYVGNGLGTNLMTFVLERYANKNIELASSKERMEAQRFYEKLGFVATHNKFVFNPFDQ